MVWLFVALGGAFGAMARYGVTTHLLPVNAKTFPWGTLTANVLGSLLIGFCYVIIVEKQLVGAHWRPLLMVGFLGAFTTYSTFALESFLLWQHGQTAHAIIYALSSLVGCVLAIVISIWLANKLIS